MSPVTDVCALEESNVWEVESLFYVSSTRRYCKGMASVELLINSGPMSPSPRRDSKWSLPTYVWVIRKSRSLLKLMRLANQCALTLTDVVRHDTVITHRTLISLSRTLCCSTACATEGVLQR